jgi:hypothetical protein
MVYELGQVDASMKLATDGHSMSIPIDEFHNYKKWGPVVMMLDV